MVEIALETYHEDDVVGPASKVNVVWANEAREVKPMRTQVNNSWYFLSVWVCLG